MKKSYSSFVAPLAGFMMIFAFASAVQAEVRLGGGLHYWSALASNEDVDVDTDGISLIASAEWAPASLISVEGNLEYFVTNGFGGGDAAAFAPQAFLLFGNSLYAGIGIGALYNNELIGDNWSGPFYTARVGFEFEIAPGVHLDLHGSYLFDSHQDADVDVDDGARFGEESDSIAFGAITRVAIW